MSSATLADSTLVFWMLCSMSCSNVSATGGKLRPHKGGIHSRTTAEWKYRSKVFWIYFSSLPPWFLRLHNKERKKHINSFNINFLTPPKRPILDPSEKIMCLISWERTQKKGTHINFFGGIFGSKRGSQTGHFRPQNVYFIVFSCHYTRLHLFARCCACLYFGRI